MSILATIAKLRLYYERPWEMVQPEDWELTRDYSSGQTISASMPTLEEYLDLFQLGYGNYSRVFALSDRVVLKVNSNEHDESYGEYARYCAFHANANPWLPRIYYRGMANNIPFYIIERLNPLLDGDCPQWLSFFQAIAEACKEGHVEFKDPHLTQLCRDVGDMFNDCGPRNIMKRGDQFVFTDPCS